MGVFRYQYAFIHDLVTANETVGFRASEVAAFPIIADEETQFSFFLSFSFLASGATLSPLPFGLEF